MGDAIFQDIIDAARLDAGWRRVRRNRGGPGGDGVTIDAFAARADTHLSTLRDALCAGRYRPGPLRAVPIAKPSGGIRHLAIPCIADRIVQHAAAAALGHRLERHLTPSSFAYRPQHSVAQAVGRLVTLRLWGYRHVLEADIADCFAGIPHDRLLATLGQTVPSPDSLRLVGLWLAGFGGHCGIAQGAPISPLLANLYLDPLDRALAGRRLKLVRYADDLVLLAQSADRLKGAEARLEAAARALDLALNPTKTRRTSFAEGFVFLGHHFQGDTVRPLATGAADPPTG